MHDQWNMGRSRKAFVPIEHPALGCTVPFPGAPFRLGDLPWRVTAHARTVEGQIVWSSQIVLTECFSALLRKERERQIGAPHRQRAWAQAERLNLITLTTEVLMRANGILGVCHPTIALRSLDAIHLASAERSQSWPICSNDGRMRLAAEQLGLPLGPLPS